MGFFGNDITMCTAQDCDLRYNCHRYTAKPDRIQSYSNFEPVCFDNGTYDYFFDNEGYDDENN